MNCIIYNVILCALCELNVVKFTFFSYFLRKNAKKVMFKMT